MSALRDAMSHAVLGWVKPELDETLRLARAEVESFVEEPDDTTRMNFCAGYLHQVQGTLRDLRAHDVDMITIGQYLQPTAHHHPVLRYWTPDEFKALEEFGMALGFAHVASGPMVRSSYHADRQAAGIA